MGSNFAGQGNEPYLNRTVQDLFSLKGRVTVITGGARGIGLAWAFACAEAGSHIAIIDRLDQPHDHFSKLMTDFDVKIKLYSYGNFLPLVQYHSATLESILTACDRADVTNYSALEQAFAKVVEDFNRIDGLITAAGICPDQPFLDRKPEDVERCFKINTLGTYYTAQLTARQIVKQDEGLAKPRGGSMVFIASIAARWSSKDQYISDYCSSKGAVVALANQLGCELAGRGIRVNSISPGYVDTDMTKTIAATRPGLIDVFLSEPPMKRMADRVDLKGAAVFLLSDASAYMTSADMLITGGMHAGRA